MMNLEGADVTGIENINNNAADMTGKAVYNLNGQRQSGLKKGINGSWGLVIHFLCSTKRAISKRLTNDKRKAHLLIAQGARAISA